MKEEVPELSVDAIAYSVVSGDNRFSRAYDSKVEVIFDEFRQNDYVSILFLLNGYVDNDCATESSDFLSIIRGEDHILKKKVMTVLKNCKSKAFLLIEILIVLKKYRLLRLLQTCSHVHGISAYCQIHQFWKFLYSLCEELSDHDVKALGDKYIGQLSRSDPMSAEELIFCLTRPHKSYYDSLVQLEKIFQDFNLSLCNLIKSFKEKMKVEFYPIKQPTSSSPCGIAVIINHEKFYRENENFPFLEERKGSFKDADALKLVWKTFGFETHIYRDLTDKQVFDLFEELRLKDHSFYDAFVVCYLSHGDEGVVYASNSKPINIRRLVDTMANDCSTLKKKPKLFFIQACQGHQISSCKKKTLESTADLHESKTLIQLLNEDSTKAGLPDFTDTLILNSAVKGYVSFRIPNEESWFVSSLKKNMLQYGDDLTISNIATKVSNEVAMQRFQQHGGLQQPMLTSMLRYELKLKKVQQANFCI
ncbi:caspase-3-like isoform X2 [Stegodyphus dumicola]|nr:caspase-3-like isoform X2 [Stegodyphus dumicola]